MSQGETRRVVQALYDAYAAGDMEAMLGLMAEDVEVRFLGQGSFLGLPAVRRFFEFSAGLLTELDWRLEKVIIDGELGCGIWSETGTTADGHPWASPGVDVIRVRDGKIVSLHENNDASLVHASLPPYVDPGA